MHIIILLCFFLPADSQCYVNQLALTTPTVSPWNVMLLWSRPQQKQPSPLMQQLKIKLTFWNQTTQTLMSWSASAANMKFTRSLLRSCRAPNALTNKLPLSLFHKTTPTTGVRNVTPRFLALPVICCHLLLSALYILKEKATPSLLSVLLFLLFLSHSFVDDTCLLIILSIIFVVVYYLFVCTSVCLWIWLVAYFNFSFFFFSSSLSICYHLVVSTYFSHFTVMDV